MKTTTSVNPYTGEKLQTYKNHTTQEVTALIEKADKCFYSWRNTSFAE